LLAWRVNLLTAALALTLVSYVWVYTSLVFLVQHAGRGGAEPRC
jgi:hypothetical protein